VRLPGGGTVGGGLFSQVSGVRLRQPRNTIERELVELGFGATQLSPKTGNKRSDALVARFQGPILEQLGEIILTTDLYRSLPVRTKQELVRNLLNISREPALELAKRVAPTVFANRKLSRLPNVKRAAIEEQLDILLRSRGSKMRAADLMEALAKKAAQELKDLGL
jgi:hypothetical protein